MKQISAEVLAPAGSYDSLKAAVTAGADAVYIGGSRFGARAYADNPQEDELLEAIDYAHLHGVKLYMTVNTLMKEDELKELPSFLEPYYRQGLDAVIVQDMGAFTCIRECFPDLSVHASTQMTVTGAYGAGLLKELGASRVVTARELSLGEIRQIHEEVDVEIESFVHGALCYSYSGQCLFSSLVGGRSGNRGRCAQACRLPYDVYKEGRLLNKKDEKYVLSLKDLCTLELIPDLLEAGVSSLKIEGRMKSPRYTAGVVRIYRKYVDRYLASGRDSYRVDEKDRKELADLFDRGGFTDGYYRRHNGRDMVVWKEKPSFKENNQALYEELDEQYVKRGKKEKIRGSVCLEPGSASALTLSMGDVTATVWGDVPQEAVNQPLTEEKIRKQLGKTGNSPFEWETLMVETAGRPFMPVQAVNELRRHGFEALEEAVLREYRRQEKSSVSEQLAGKPSPVRTYGGQRQSAGGLGAPARPVELSAALERPEVLPVALGSPSVSRVYIDAAGFEPSGWETAVKACRAAGKACLLALPQIFRSRACQYFDRHLEAWLSAGFDGVLVRSLEEVGYMRRRGISLPMVFDFGMYAMNSLAQEQMLSWGASELTLPVELNARELKGLPYPGELVAYGRLPMMVTAQCIRQGLDGCESGKGRKAAAYLALKDRTGREFPVKNDCSFCCNTIYNAAPISLIGMEEAVKEIAPLGLRLQFTTETPEEAERVIGAYEAAFLRGEKAPQPVDTFTRGHIKRGIE